jgi:hypothetical protein
MFVSCECLCCQVEVSATGRSLVQGSPTECGVRDIEASTMRRPRPTRGTRVMGKEYKLSYRRIIFLDSALLTRSHWRLRDCQEETAPVVGWMMADQLYRLWRAAVPTPVAVLDCWDRGFEFCWKHRYTSVLLVMCCVGSGLCDGLIFRSQEPYPVCVCPIVCDLGASTMTRPRPELGPCATGIKKNTRKRLGLNGSASEAIWENTRKNFSRYLVRAVREHTALALLLHPTAPHFRWDGGGGKPVYITGARRSGWRLWPAHAAYVSVFIGSIITCRLYKLSLWDQHPVPLHLTDGLSYLVYRFLAGRPLLGGGGGPQIFVTGIRTLSRRPWLP